MKMETLESLLKGENLKYYLDPARPAAMLGFQGLLGKYQFVILLEMEGSFLQFRSVELARCPVEHPYLSEVLRVIGSIDHQFRFVKFGWDADGGEIVGYGDVCLANDGTLTPAQFKQILRHYLTTLELGAKRISDTIDTGRDPGRISLAQLVTERLDKKGGVPSQMRAVLEKIKRKTESNLDEI